MTKLVVNCFTDGIVETTLKDSFFPVKFLGPRVVKRMTDIKYHWFNQKFYIEWLEGPNKGEVISNEHGDTFLFDTYEEAVTHEIDVVNEMRLEGVRIA